jgi:hypothetical protein
LIKGLFEVYAPIHYEETEMDGIPVFDAAEPCNSPQQGLTERSEADGVPLKGPIFDTGYAAA